jgi:transcription initiation factor TFIIB
MDVTTQSENCPECGGSIKKEQTEMICSSCGLVHQQENIDLGPDWRSDSDEETDCRVGPPLTSARHDNGLSTKIGYETGIEVPEERQRQFVRLRRQHNRAQLSKSQQNKLYAYTEIRQLVSSLSLSKSVRDQACQLFDSAQSESLLHGRSIEGFAAAVVYATCRMQSIARTREEILTEASADQNELTAAYDALNSELGLPVGVIDPREYIARYASELDLGPSIERRAREHVVRLKQNSLIGGKNPSGVAAACLFYAVTEHHTTVNKDDLTDVAAVSWTTISSTVSNLESTDNKKQ